MIRCFDKTRVNIVLDHFVPNKDIKSAQQSKKCREFADKYDILNFYDVGTMGIEHALLPEKGIVTAGDCIIGADSHTCTYGAVGGFLDRRRLDRYGRRHGDRHGLVQGAGRDQGRAQRPAAPPRRRQGRDPCT